jgi:MarR family transcriptional regulator for hemolysin
MSSPEECAQQVLETIPLLMQTIRSGVRRLRNPDLSVPQFRTLAILHHEPGSSLSALADVLGLTPPAMSRLVDGLVKRGLVTRKTSAVDRRRVGLGLTAAGSEAWLTVHKAARTKLAGMLGLLPAQDRVTVAKAMQALRRGFSRNGRQEPGAAATRRPTGSVAERSAPCAR